MGMYAEVIAIGPYNNELLPHLEYSSKHYEGTCEGAIISQTLFGIAEGSSLSREFAKCLSISDPWDFNQHKINVADIDLETLRAFVSQYQEYQSDFENFVAFMEHGYEFHFAPNG